MDEYTMRMLCFGSQANVVSQNPEGQDITCCRRCGAHVPSVYLESSLVNGAVINTQQLHAMWHMAMEANL